MPIVNTKKNAIIGIKKYYLFQLSTFIFHMKTPNVY